ncbi:TipJ family phage tail tip protein, partial [Nitratidesulfovibrio sp. 1201_IL3209]|uniref:TipJ family phage tail tip protein n=1 Tax=Nitratidesulfovibrio sp. 1201_IL3209 TaxID=3084053 RepID=UPI002FD9E733
MTRNPEVVTAANLPALLADAPPLYGQASRMVYRPDLLSLRTVDLVVPTGVSVLAAMRQALRDAGHSPSILRGARIDINGVPVPRSEWGARLMRPGDLASLHVPVRGGGGGSGKNPLGTLLSLVVVVAAAALTYGAAGAWGAGLVAGTSIPQAALVGGIAGLSMMAMWGVSQLFPPAVAKLGSTGSSLSAEKTWAITGTQNQVDPYGPIPFVLGKVRFAHRMATRGYTLLSGQTVIARILYVVMGRNRVTDQRIGDTPLAQVTGARTVVHENWRGEPLKFIRNVFENSFDATVTNSGGEVTKTTQADATGCSLEIYYPQGLVRIDKKNRRYTASVTLRVEISASGSTTRLPAFGDAGNTVTHSAATVTPQRRGISITFPSAGKWNVHVKRMTADANDNDTEQTLLDDSKWVKLRSFVPGRPVIYEGFPLTLIEAEFRANDALDGVIDAYSAVMESYAPVPQEGGGWLDQPTNRPSALGYLLTSGKYASGDRIIDVALDAEDMHDDVWRDFHAWCEAMDWQYNSVITSEGTIADVLAPVLRAARGGYAILDGLHAVAWDAPDKPVSMIYGPRNSWGFRASKTMPERMPHGRRFAFLNEEKDYEEDERVVYADGYDAGTATYVIDDEQEGVTNPGLIWKFGRLHIADSIHRAETFEWQTDFSHLMVQKGSVVDHVHDALLTGIAQARVIGAIPDPEDDTRIIGVILDEDVTMEAGVTYMLRQYTAASMSTAWAVQTVPGTGRELYWPVVDEETGEHLSTPAAASPQFDDMVVFGVSGRETLRLVVTGIYPEQDFVARITAQMEGTDVYAAIDGPVPPFVSGITSPSRWSKGKPAVPTILSLRSDETVLLRLADGSLVPRVAVSFEAATVRDVEAATVRVQVRVAGSEEEWRVAGSVPAIERVVYATDVEEGVEIEVRVQAVSTLGVGSDWSAPLLHTVVGKLSPPPDIPELMRDGDMLRWSYPDAPLDLAGFLVRFSRNPSASWEMATPVPEGTVPTAVYDMSRYAGAETLWMVRAVDTGGRMSAGTARLVADIGGPEIANIVDEIDLRAMGWPGAHDGEVDGDGNLSA